MTNAIQKWKGAATNDLGYVVDNMFNNTLRRFFDANFWDAEGPGNKGRVPVNVRESEHQYELDVIAPGCKRDDFKVQVLNNELRVSFQQDEKKQQGDEKAGWVRNEYTLHSFTRIFTLDDTVDPAGITASYKDGILRVVLPKTEKAKPRQLSIDVK